MIVRLTPEARSDLLAIGSYIARDNPTRAVSFMRELRSKCRSLGDKPHAFPLVPVSRTMISGDGGMVII